MVHESHNPTGCQDFGPRTLFHGTNRKPSRGLMRGPAMDRAITLKFILSKLCGFGFLLVFEDSKTEDQ